ncbi:MAG: hypothetical protein A2268_00145 [Candidatus Raymondbacteria bacterium RifOxyA12_full_50_37]|uniref:Aldose epimerase n=1 Tax=Candidatus Raymondbacteria bacterium RIFOXYD12_FULL_49_13 TaxID=1817890 RepID=A0A1F7F252_UNCRA|nr:MAG: hypothetical protein A2268_00145 [Candidatus Raymondbacteria bacterium RifOxyA12_full_50_37]OGJ92729.1 MAG: hypothetical protein A2248_04195 [Candidatus Raymondbacteria bacterium RIFOXYA2_FULL_49_16]OGJ95920.1 MAG: hypothetical protein A2487_04480 [Candidatus Raymondbacteria bacterium RifOxyC12_full_50_8]OGK00739.1 MAG: hypothetical protein A2519_19925 [Candidatus Raymondbacteria bacterium RIFOXYD12_FULL_49_13]OGK04192.1 MAG: hypothetical protein A2350_02710 [Candidatus Raymondbacteria 
MARYTVEKETKPGFDRLVDSVTKSAVFIKRLGCEVIGYDVFDPQRGKTIPMLWNNNNDTPVSESAWKNHATVLFPHVGAVHNNASVLGAQKITTPGGHGFARKSVFQLAKVSESDCASATYLLQANDETLKYFPFRFKLEITYCLKDSRLSATFTVTNKDTQDIYYQFGWHPGFSTDMGLGGKKSDWQILLPKGKYLEYIVADAEDSYMTGEAKPVSLDGPIAWNEKSLNKTIVFEVTDTVNRRCRIFNPKLNIGVEAVYYDFPHLGLWAGVNQPFICIEPWQGMDDRLEQEPWDKKIGMLKVAPGVVIRKTAEIIPILS